MIKRRAFISVPMDDHLDQGRREVVQAVLQLLLDEASSHNDSFTLGCPHQWDGIFRPLTR